MKLTSKEKERISSGDVRFLEEILKKDLEDVTERLLVFKESKGMDDLLKGRAHLLIELLKVLEK